VPWVQSQGPHSPCCSLRCWRCSLRPESVLSERGLLGMKEKPERLAQKHKHRPSFSSLTSLPCSPFGLYTRHKHE
jgi:hypothetical protein